MALPVVDLPLPLSPTKPTVFPLGMEKLIESTAFTVSVFREKIPRLLVKCTFKSLTVIKFAIVIITNRSYIMIKKTFLLLTAILILSACTSTKNEQGITIKKKNNYNPIHQIKKLF